MHSHQAPHDLQLENGFPSHLGARGERWNHLPAHLEHQGQLAVTCFPSLGLPDQCLMTHLPSLQGIHGLVVTDSTDKGQDSDHWVARILSPLLKVDFKSHFHTQARKRLNTRVFQRMDLYCRPREDLVRHLATIHSNKAP